MSRDKDPRCAYIAQTAAAMFAAPALAETIANAPEVVQFVNELTCKVLQILSDGTKCKFFAGQMANPPAQALEIHFLKLAEGSDELEAGRIQSQIMISSMRGSSVHSLHAYLSNVYGPVLFGQSEASGAKTDTQLRDLLYSLKAGLQKTIRKGGNSLAQADFNQDEFRGILSPSDEIECWQENERENIGAGQNEKLGRKAAIINQHFSKIATSLSEIDTLELGQITVLVDQIQDVLDPIWRDPNINPVYPQARMEHFFKVTSKTLGARIEREFKQHDIWQASFSDVRVKLNECMRICRGWKDRITELTRDFWKAQNEKHQWQGKPFMDNYLENIIIRINVIFELRSQHDELLRLLTPEERDRLKVHNTFDPFRKINSFYTNEYQAATWQRAMKEYERTIEPMEKELCQKLRKEIFAEGKATPSQLLREFQRWKGLLSKDSIKKELQQERENLLAQLVGEVQKSKEEFEARTGQSLEQIPGMEKPPQSQNVSDTVSAIIWSRQLSLKLQQNLKAAQTMFGDLGGMAKLNQDSSDLCKQIRSFEEDLFNKWVDRIKKALQDPNQKHKYQMTGQLMEFDFNHKEGGLLKVNYSEKLVTLVKDARILGEHGFKIPKPVNDVTENAKKFYKEGVTLKQVANFYNSMGTQMIDCQKPMMIEKLQGFEYIIQNPKGQKSGGDGSSVTWNDPIEIENYIKQVQARATDLIAENRKLRKVHLSVTDMVIELMNIDLLKNRGVWKDNLAKMKRIIETVTKSRSPEMCKLWLAHLNYQLYKALEFQYQMGLESLNESLPEISADLVYRNQTIEFRPTFEELKSKYYNEISVFITIPLKFVGVGATEIFKLMPEQNSKHLKTVYNKAEELFSRLNAQRAEYMPWTALGNLDIQTYIEQNFTSVQDWEDNFQMLRQKRKELKKIPDSFKVDCININIVPFKAGVEELFRRMTDALVETLQESIEKDADQVHSFIKKGLDKLSKNPKSVDEINQMNQDAMQIGVEKSAVVKVFQGCELKNKMIKQMTGVAMRGMGEIESMWREFDARLAAFQDKIEEQKTRLVQELDTRVKTLNSDLEKLYDKWNEKKPKERNQLTYEEALETAETMREMKAQWTALEDKVNKVKNDCEHFGKGKPTLTFYDKMKDELEEQSNSWSLFETFKTEMEEFTKEEWLTFRKKGYFGFQEFFLQQAEKMKALPKNVVVKFLLQMIENYKQAWPLIKMCTGESFEKEHWRRLINILALPKDITVDNMKFGHLIDAVPTMLKKAKDIKELADKAQGEVTIREAINELRNWCDSTEFVLSEYESNGRQTPLIKEWKEVITQVSDHQSLIASLKESRYFASFSDQIQQFEQKFGGIDDHLAKLNTIQRKWVYLEPIFMRGALPQEQGRFKRVDEEYRSIALAIGGDPKVMSLCEIHGLKDTLETILTQLDMCQKALNDYLEEKRQKFSRFYFIGDDDLLEILGQSQNPLIIQTHLKKLFSGIYKVEFSKDNTKINSMISSQGEYVQLSTPVQISVDVEQWLGDLEKVMRLTLDTLLRKTVGSSTGLDIVNMPSQVCCLAEMLAFSNNCVKAIQQQKLANYKQDLQKQLESYTSFDNKGDGLLFVKIKALILDIIHNVQVVDDLLADQIVNTKQPNDWMWFKQLRYSLESQAQGRTLVGMCDAFFDYTYEYQGNAPKLVHTPLTDKCYLTLVMGMKLGYGGNPYGPAGTGKTESVKALGQAFGRQVLVFNCDEGLDYKAMGRIFIGLVKCGAWGCFDEFNRLLEEQLSAISQQIQVIQWAIKNAQPTLELLGRNISVNKNAGIFVTLNPAGKGYGGRSKLPDNLKQLFRPVAMSAPDLELIAETMLYSEGFKHAKKLSTKVVSLFKLCKQLLSTQQHYDWQLRAQKTILSTGGQLIQQELKKGRKLAYEDEALILIKSIRVNTISKLTYSDAYKYEALQADMFPGIKSEDIAYEQLTAAITKTFADNKLQLIDKQVQKILQFQEATKQRMGVVIVGPSGCGKTTIWKTLKMAYEKMGHQIVTHVMNPKSMPREQLLGHMNHDTREFNDGVLTASARLVVKEPQETICWIVCDGDIDPEWIESLNSVMDDNHLLTLPNGERISFGDNVNFIFETNDLRFASPATVSRLGMIFLSEEDVDVTRITKTWVNKQPEALQSKLTQWVTDIFFPSLEWVLQRQDQMIEQTTKVGVVNNCLSYLQNIENKGQFTYGCILGLGSNFKYDVRTELGTLVLQVAGERVADPKNLLLNYYDSPKQQWLTFIQQNPGTLNINDIKNPEAPPLYLTTTIQRDVALVKPLLDKDESFILVGPEGCGKNLVIRSLIKQMKSTQMAVIHCNAQTSAFHVIQKLNQMCAQSTNASGRVYRPKEVQRLIIYLKDINLPKPDKYDTIQLISFLQQLICYKGFYDDNLDFVSLERVTIVASMNPSSTLGRHKISTRFTANVKICYMDYPNAEELLPVYAEFMKTILTHPRFGNGQMATSSKRLSTFLIDLYTQVKGKFSVDEHRHYLFTPRDITTMIFSMLRYEIPEAQALIEILIYESNRVFRDRLVDRENKKKFDNILYASLKNHLKYQDKLVDTYFISLVMKGNESLIPGLPSLGRIGKNDFITMVQGAMRAYEREFKELDIHLVEEVLEMIAYVERVLSMPGGCLLLAGRSGIGRKASTQLVAQLLNMEFFSPHINRDYGMKEFKRDLKYVLQKSGIEAVKTCLFIEDHQLLKEEFLELLNSLISAGEVPGLYTPEELEPLLAQIKDEMANQFECRTVFEFFVSRVKKYLSVVYSADNKHPKFQQNCAYNPSLFNKCTILWNESFSKESLVQIARNELTTCIDQLGKNAEEIINGAVYLHNQAGSQFIVSPQKFLNLVQCYRNVFMNIVSKSGGQTKHLISGLEKLSEAQKAVDKLSTEANEKKKKLGAAQKEAATSMQKIQVSMEQKAERKQEVEGLQAQCNKDQQVIEKRKTDVESELSGVQPEVDAARAAVGQLKPANLNEIKAFRQPPQAVVDVLSAVMIFLGQTDTSWQSMRGFLSNSGVIQTIMNFDARQVTPKLRSQVNKIIASASASFEQSVISNASRAAAPLAAWCVANVKYSEVLLKIEPLTSELDGLLDRLKQSQQRVEECQVQLTQISTQTEKLNNDFQKKTMEAARLEADLNQAEQTLNAAQQLLQQLSGENERWRQQVQTLEREMSLVPSRALISSAYLTYLGSANETIREASLKEWLSGFKQPSYNFRNFLSSESEMLTWKKEGLPADTLSMENAIMIMNSQRTSLVIDPATQASEWLKTTLKKVNDNVEVLNHQDTKFNTTLELSIRFGKVLIIQEVDGIESMLVPILRKDLIQQGPRQVVQIGEKSVDYNPQFRLYLTTRDQFVDIPPNCSSLVTLVNFTVTKSGLEGQLLSITINFEQPELEARKTKLLEEEERLKIQLADFEKQLLTELANSSGNILENKTLIDSLNQTKIQSTQIEKSLSESKNLQVSLDQQREVYRNFSHIGSNLFMVFGDLIKMNNMYQFSLASFIKLFNKALNTKPQSASTEQKLQLLSDSLIRLCYSEIGRSLFKSDRLTYSMHFVKGVFPNLFQKNEWEFFAGQTIADANSGSRLPKWVSPDRQEIFAMFANTFAMLVQQLQLDNEGIWSDFAKSEQPERNFPQQVSQRISSFQKCILIQVLRPDRLESAMNQFVKEAFNNQTVQPASFILKNLYEQETTCNDPIMFIISPGSDPSAELQQFAEQVVGRAGYHELAMGGGQNEIAIETIKQAAQKGEWVCLKNLHLVTPWLSVLEKEFKMLKPNNKFRLWLTSEPHLKFPSILLQSSLKITYETPPGVRNNLQRTFQYVMPAGGQAPSNPIQTQLLFILSWFHALLQERRTYIPQGWVKYYEFSYGDLMAGEQILSSLVAENKGGQSPAWQKVYGILENAIYGGRVDNEFDMRVLRTYMQTIFQDGTLKGQQMLSGLVNAPQTGKISDFVQTIQKLPETDNPEIFGLPVNIDRSVQRFNSNIVIQSLKALAAVSAQELRFNKELWTEQLGPICQLWQNVFKPELFKQIKITANDMTTQDPIDQFVYLEMTAIRTIIEKVNDNITSIIGVLQGTIMLTPSTQSIAIELLKNQLPLTWEKLWDGPVNPSTWIRILNKKGVALCNWVQKVQKGGILKSPVNLSDLLHPETFLNAFRQRSARQFKVAIDELKLVSSFENGKLQKEGSIQLEGLYLQGCAFDGIKLADIRGQQSEILPLPVCNISWISDKSQDPYPPEQSVETPVYHGIDREKLLCTFKMANNGSAGSRIISGVALLLNSAE